MKWQRCSASARRGVVLQAVDLEKLLTDLTLPQVEPAASALQSLVNLSRARSRDQMQLALLQLHQSIAAHLAPPAPALASPELMSPSALSALLTPSGSGFRVDFGAALTAIHGVADGDVDPLDVSLSPLMPPPSAAARPHLQPGPRSAKRQKSDDSWAESLLADSLLDSPRASPRMKPPPTHSQSTIATSSSGPPAAKADAKAEAPRKPGLVRPGGSLSVDVSGVAPVTQASLSQAPLSALLSAFGFGSGGFTSPNFDSAFGLGSARGLPTAPQTVSSPQLLGFSPESIAAFMGPSSSLLEAALDAPLSSHPMSRCRRSPRLLDG